MINTTLQQLGVNEDDARRIIQQRHDRDRRWREASAGQSPMRELARILPVSGDILTSEDGKPVKVYENWKDRAGEPYLVRFVYAAIDDKLSGWYLHSRPIGLIVLLTFETHDNVRLEDGTLVLDSVCVVRQTKTGRALLGDAQ